VGPKVVRLQQIATGGSSVPRRGGQPSIRGTEASTQAVINAVYVQILGNAGYAGERNKVEEIKLENGDINLREFVRQVARSTAFRRRYWSGLYITKAIEVMHRRILGRPTFGRWEIDAYFDTAARSGFYGVVDKMLSSREYNDCFGEDTVPYERFITAGDRNARKVPGLNRPFNAAAYADLSGGKRPDVAPPQSLRTTTDVVSRNLAERPRVVMGGWSAQIAGGETMAAPTGAVPTGPGSIRQAPAPNRRWKQTPATTTGFWSSAPAGAPSSSSTRPLISGDWRAAVGSGQTSGLANQPGAAMAKAIQPGRPQGFGRRQSVGRPVRLGRSTTETQVQEALETVYKQLLNRVPFTAERLGDAESQFRNQQLTVAELVTQIAGSELFQQRLNRMAPLRAAAAAYLALLGRAAQPQEVSAFLATRANRGQQAAIDALLSSQEYAEAFGQDTVPYIRGLATADGIPLATVNRTAQLYGGNAGLTPGPKAAI
jgi:phycobilisome core-membrane linker protein